MKREPGIDLVRVMGLFFVNGIHFFLKNGFYSEAQVGAAIWGADCFRWLFFSCNGLFLLLTGYLKSTKPFTKDYYKSLIPVLVGYGLTCLITYPIRHYAMGERMNIFQWIGNFLTFGNYAWYLEMYIGLILFSPVINLALEKIQGDKQLLWFAGMMVALTALPSVTGIDLIPDYWTGIYPLTFYVIGAVIRRLQPEVKLWQGIPAIALVVMFMGWVSLISTDQGFSRGFTQGNGDFWNTLVATLVFLTFYRVRIPEWTGKVLGWMAKGVLEGYLLSLVLDRSLYAAFRQWHAVEHYPVLFLCGTVPIFLLSVLGGRAVHELTLWLCRRWIQSEKAHC